ncbi:unnamed protein product, partial [Iphiclides podalirius]
MAVDFDFIASSPIIQILGKSCIVFGVGFLMRRLDDLDRSEERRALVMSTEPSSTAFCAVLVHVVWLSIYV